MVPRTKYRQTLILAIYSLTENIGIISFPAFSLNFLILIPDNSILLHRWFSVVPAPIPSMRLRRPSVHNVEKWL